MSASVISESSSASVVDQALALVSEMSFVEKLAFNSKFASLLMKETKGAGAMAKAAKKEKKEKDPDAPKRVAGAGQKAWFAYIDHCIATMTERFEGVPLRKDKLAIVKAIRAEQKEEYDAFVAKYKEDHAGELPSPKEPKEPKEKKEKKERKAKAPKEDKEEKPFTATSVAVAEVEKPMSAKEKIAALKAKKEAEAAAKPASEAKPTKDKKAVKKGSASTTVAASSSSTDASLGRVTVEGVDYHRDMSMNGLWKVDDDGEGFGAWVGYYQPGNKDEPIRFTESPSDD